MFSFLASSHKFVGEFWLRKCANRLSEDLVSIFSEFLGGRKSGMIIGGWDAEELEDVALVPGGMVWYQHTGNASSDVNRIRVTSCYFDRAS